MIEDTGNRNRGTATHAVRCWKFTRWRVRFALMTGARPPAASEGIALDAVFCSVFSGRSALKTIGERF